MEFFRRLGYESGLIEDCFREMTDYKPARACQSCNTSCVACCGVSSRGRFVGAVVAVCGFVEEHVAASDSIGDAGVEGGIGAVGV